MPRPMSAGELGSVEGGREGGRESKYCSGGLLTAVLSEHVCTVARQELWQVRRK